MYRIKIEERNNGEKRYVPQFGKPLLKIGKFKFLYLEWWNIRYLPEYFKFPGKRSFDYSKTIKMSFDTEEEALSIIEECKEYIQIKKDEEIKRTTFKLIN